MDCGLLTLMHFTGHWQTARTAQVAPALHLGSFSWPHLFVAFFMSLAASDHIYFQQ
jgi:hypothetical protein